MGEEISSRVGAAIEAEIAPLLKLTNGPELLSLNSPPHHAATLIFHSYSTSQAI